MSAKVILESFQALYAMDKRFREWLDQISEQYIPVFGITEQWRDLLSKCLHIVGSSADGAVLARMCKAQPLLLEVDIMFQMAEIESKKVYREIIVEKDKTPGIVHVRSGAFKKQTPAVIKKKVNDCERNHLIPANHPDSCMSTEDIKHVLEKMIKIRDNDGEVLQILSFLFKRTEREFKMDWNIEFHGPAVNMNIIVKMNEGYLAKLSLDGVPIIQMNIWPDIAQTWPSRTGRHWPPSDVICVAMKQGCQLVPKPVKASETRGVGDVNAWRVTFTLAERALMKACSAPQRMVYLIAKTLFYAHLDLSIDGHDFPSYAVKTTFLWMLELTPAYKWESDTIYLVQQLYSSLLEHLKQASLPSHFAPEAINVLAECPARLRDIVSDHIQQIITSSLQNTPYTHIPQVIDMAELFITKAEQDLAVMEVVRKLKSRQNESLAVPAEYTEEDLD